MSVNIEDWFDCENPDHAAAWLCLCKTGIWPEGFLLVPDHVEVTPQWQVKLAMAMAQRWAQHVAHAERKVSE